LALGEMGMTVDDFYDMLPRQFANKVKGYRRKEKNLQLRELYALRWQTTTLINSRRKAGEQLKETDLMLMPWEKKIIEDRKKLTWADIKNMKW
jgi:hypothetical protein